MEIKKDWKEGFLGLVESIKQKYKINKELEVKTGLITIIIY